MTTKDSIDVNFSWDGDFDIDETGDIADTSSDTILSLENEIRTIARSEIMDWEMHPILGANLSDFRGEPNTRETAKAMEQQLLSRIIAAGLVKQGDISIRIVPTGLYEVLIMIKVNVVATPTNRLQPGEELVITFTYDSMEDSVLFIETDQLERSAR